MTTHRTLLLFGPGRGVVASLARGRRGCHSQHRSRLAQTRPRSGGLVDLVGSSLRAQMHAGIVQTVAVLMLCNVVMPESRLGGSFAAQRQLE